MTSSSAQGQPGAGEVAEPSLVRREGVALWRQISAVLEAEILARRIAPGTRLPNETALASRFGVNRHTVRQALGDLADRGMVRAEQGRGTFVEESMVDYRIGQRTRFRDNLLGQQRAPKGELVGVETVRAARPIARALDIRAGSSVVIVTNVGFADGRPISFGRHHFPARRFDGIAEVFARTSSVTASLAEFGVVDYTRASTRVITRMPTVGEARRLKVPKTRPVLVTQSVNVDPQGRPVEYGEATFAGDRVQLVFEP